MSRGKAGSSGVVYPGITPIVVINWRGIWSSSLAYDLNDGVSYLGICYVATATSYNAIPLVGVGWALLNTIV